MDATTILMAIMLIKSLPGSVSAEAVQAAEDAAASAAVAATHNYGISVDANNKLVITAPESE